ncbi:hypothetical protein EYF80_029571 [Liparis tanakae]|uniref:Uncharacterized protein n=1 Tax=Liparis tanakae TaxID=230148 RepID=A0A4Z2H353_9TELE|nr:hypothetical protein EYF80_029571 [Liparis tanakae]
MGETRIATERTYSSAHSRDVPVHACALKLSQQRLITTKRTRYRQARPLGVAVRVKSPPAGLVRPDPGSSEVSDCLVNT